MYANKLYYVQNFSFINEKCEGGGGGKAFNVVASQNTIHNTTQMTCHLRSPVLAFMKVCQHKFLIN